MTKFVLISTHPSIRRSNVPLLPRVANNGTEAPPATSPGALNRPPSAGDTLRKISYTRKVNRSSSEKTNAHSTPPSGSQQHSPVSSFV